MRSEEPLAHEDVEKWASSVLLKKLSSFNSKPITMKPDREDG